MVSIRVGGGCVRLTLPTSSSRSSSFGNTGSLSAAKDIKTRALLRERENSFHLQIMEYIKRNKQERECGTGGLRILAPPDGAQALPHRISADVSDVFFLFATRVLIGPAR